MPVSVIFLSLVIKNILQLLYYSVVGQDFRNGSNYDLSGARVTQDGFVLDSAGFAICVTDYHQMNPSVAFDGTDYLVVWKNKDPVTDESDIYGARVSKFLIFVNIGNQLFRSDWRLNTGKFLSSPLPVLVHNGRTEVNWLPDPGLKNESQLHNQRFPPKAPEHK